MIPRPIHRDSRGFSLVEVTLALGVAAFCLLALFGLLPIGVNSNQATVQQTAAASIAASVVADLRSTSLVYTPPGAPTPTSTPTSKQFGIPVPPTTTNPSIYTLFVKDGGGMAQKSTAAAKTNGWDVDSSQNPNFGSHSSLTLQPCRAN